MGNSKMGGHLKLEALTPAPDFLKSQMGMGGHLKLEALTPESG